MSGQNNTSFLTILSVFLVLVLLGLYAIVFIHSNVIGKFVKEQLNVVIELAPDVNDAQTTRILNLIKENQAVKQESVRFVSKNEALNLMSEEIGSSQILSSDENPFSDAYIINLYHNFYTKENMEEMEQTFTQTNGVSSVYYEKNFYEKAHSNIQRISFLSFLFGILLLVLAGALIFNTIYLSLVSDESKIRLKELVGAKRRYIKMPYMRKAFRIGWVSAVAACIFISILLFITTSQIPLLKSILNLPYTLVVFVVLILLGVLIPMAGTNRIVSKYLNNLYTY